MLKFIEGAGIAYLAAKHERYAGDIWRSGKGDF
jgi:hypothetical protein